MDHVIWNHGQVTWTTPELAPPLLTTTPHQREDVSALDRFNVHRCPTRQVFKDNMLTKYQMIKFIDFWEVWFLPESVARLAAIDGEHRCHTTRH
ncbi:uncharacterized protein TNCV_2642861 [Trichonephila clavipes]|nr:uncharacterized protein TNCV_2642861 [Trichonephila clavipes]